MAEEQAVDEQEKDSQAQQEGSTLGRLKSRVKDLVGTDSEEANKGSDGEEHSSAEADSDDAEAQGSDEESASGEQEDAESASGEGEGSEDGEGGVSTDDVDLSTVAEDEETARAQIDKMEEDGPPEDLADWPTGKAMYLSFGGAEGEEGYEEGPARQMGPSSLRHHADGSVEVQGEKVDNPEDYKAEQSVGDEAENLGIDKGAKSEGDEGEDDEGEDSSSEESSSSEQDPQAESSGDASAEGGHSESDGSESDASEGQQAESETADTS